MATRYEEFNEVTFESYVKSAIDKSILKERLKKTARGQWEQSYSTLTDAILYEISHEDTEISQSERSCQIFRVRNVNIPVYGKKLGQALSYLMPKDREIILLYFFVGEKTDRIACMMDIDPTTVRRRRKAALQKLRVFLEDTR